MTEDEDKGMEYATLEVPWDGDEEVQRTVRLGWFVTVVYIVLVVAASMVPIFWPRFDEGVFLAVYMFIVVGGAILLIIALSKPLPRPPGGDVTVKDGLAVEAGVSRKLRPGETYYLRIRFNLILYIILPMVVFFGVLALFISDRTSTLIIAAVTALMVVIGIVFINFEVKADRKTLSFKFGHFGKEIPLDEISHISVTKVNAMRDFTGYGYRIGPDGSIGYIVQGGAGFRVETDKGKRYVVTIPEPGELVEYVRAAMAERDEG